MKVKDLKPADYNPRTISAPQLKRLKKALDEYGDLSGIVYNVRTGNLVGGHQRHKCLPASAAIIKTPIPPTRSGTVGQGTITVNGEQFSYREVDWPIEREKAANIAANKHGGQFDNNLLSGLLDELQQIPSFDIDLLGFETLEIDNILKEIPQSIPPPDPGKEPGTMRKCFTPIMPPAEEPAAPRQPDEEYPLTFIFTREEITLWDKAKEQMKAASDRGLLFALLKLCDKQVSGGLSPDKGGDAP